MFQNGVILYNMAFHLLLPAFQCEQLVDEQWSLIDTDSEDHITYCKPEYFCEHEQTMRWAYVPSSTTLRNWMTEYRLECASSA